MIRFPTSLFTRPALFIYAGIGITLATTGVTVASLYEMRLDAMAQARVAAQNLVISLQKEIERNLDIYQLAMRDVATSAETPSIIRLPPEVRQLVAFSSAANAAELGALFATDAAGKLILDSRSIPPRKLSVSGRDYFQIQRLQSNAGLYISAPFLPYAEEPEIPQIALSRRLEDKDGQFAGIVAGTLRLSYFRHLFEDSILGRHDTITLLRMDGTVLMRQPFHVGDIGKSLAGGHSFEPLVRSGQGTYIDIAVLDHVERLYTFRRIGSYPLVVVVGFATDDIFAGWRKRAITIGIVSVILDALLILLLLMFSRQLRKRLAMERRLQRLAWFDSLTGLPNRVQLQREALRMLTEAKRTGTTLAVLFIDLDRFKRVNDTQGHSAGDEVLREIARRLQDQIHTGDVIGRLGGDEFLAVLRECDVLKAKHVAGRILQAVFQPILINSKQDTRITISASIGIALSPLDGEETDILLRNADLAMYRAKSAGRNQMQFYAPEYERQAKEQLELEIALQRALRANALSVAYQPKVDATGVLCGVEALVRWDDDRQGSIAPDRFIAIAEESGLIAEMDAWVMGEACRQLAQWRAEGLDVPNVSVNVCAADFKRPDYPGFVIATLQFHGLAAADLTLEMTERVLFDESVADIRKSLDAIHALGVALSIDDFGTGYSSLSYLHRFAVKELKIDKSFVQGIGRDAMAESLTQTLVRLGKILKLTVTAEGVETHAQRDFLRTHGCHLYQGFLFSPPLAPHDFARWVRALPAASPTSFSPSRPSPQANPAKGVRFATNCAEKAVDP
ncbi:diguanylate cyclase (GGDEF)-like protein [Paraburkholderia silvatlantica]|uniref:Diguanylate cyclase (GGDEF)-like protein n=1 Tax=Paraburkholderia silvatlantica TaxID=321895 RepID=A0A2V4TB73_9BURK|nr:EAL domain-containing protein [Paraburkholderia silvatlantica]PYE20516.1 diguanylate cyclase (GGDEF)-like protein [Paraburkholderia silvatlantica]